MEQTLKLLIVLITSLFSLATMGQKFHTEFKYDDTLNRGITIQNSYPKGGQKYTAPNGKAYVYVIFWTRVTNETDADLELSVDFPIDSFTVPSSPDIYFHLYLPKEEMTLDKESLFNYLNDLP